jgi:hypothetical protein
MTGKNGRSVWFEINEIPVVKNGKTVSIVGSMVDITEKKAVEEALAEAEDLFKDFNAPKKRSYNHAPPAHEKGAMTYVRSILSLGKEKEEDDDFPEIPKDLKKLIKE